MKNLTLIALTLLLTACGGGGSGGSSGGGGHVPDTTPHDYVVTVAALTNTNQAHPADLHQICDFGYPGVRDEMSSVNLQDPSTVTGVGCTAAKNYVFEISNTGTDDLYLVIEIDGVQMPQETVAAGQTFTFTRGY